MVTLLVYGMFIEMRRTNICRKLLIYLNCISGIKIASWNNHMIGLKTRYFVQEEFWEEIRIDRCKIIRSRY